MSSISRGRTVTVFSGDCRGETDGSGPSLAGGAFDAVELGIVPAQPVSPNNHINNSVTPRHPCLAISPPFSLTSLQVPGPLEIIDRQPIPYHFLHSSIVLHPCATVSPPA